VLRYIEYRSAVLLKGRNATHSISRRPQHLLINAWHCHRRKEDKVLATDDLAIYILVVVSVKGGDAARVADPEVNGIGV
jgi:hypothetical protein